MGSIFNGTFVSPTTRNQKQAQAVLLFTISPYIMCAYCTTYDFKWHLGYSPETANDRVYAREILRVLYYPSISWKNNHNISVFKLSFLVHFLLSWIIRIENRILTRRKEISKIKCNHIILSYKPMLWVASWWSPYCEGEGLFYLLFVALLWCLLLCQKSIHLLMVISKSENP